jgi:hypothetical protein
LQRCWKRLVQCLQNLEIRRTLLILAQRCQFFDSAEYTGYDVLGAKDKRQRNTASSVAAYFRLMFWLEQVADRLELGRTLFDSGRYAVKKLEHELPRRIDFFRVDEMEPVLQPGYGSVGRFSFDGHILQ